MALSKYSVGRGVEINLIVDESKRIRVVCTKPCPWLLFASTNNRSGDFVVKTYNPEHRCNRVFKNKRATRKFLVSYFRDHVTK